MNNLKKVLLFIMCFILFGCSSFDDLMGFDKNKIIIIPDVSGKTIQEATNLLVDNGLIVSDDYKYVESDKVEKGNVVKTSPEIGTKRKTGTKIVLYISSGNDTYIMEDYIGKNYLEVKSIIEANCKCNVFVETKKVNENTDSKENTVIETIPYAGQEYSKGKEVTLIIPEIEYKYPDFTNGYTKNDVDAFCKEHELNIEYREVVDASKPEGTIIKQSREKGSIVTPGATIIITITKNK